jgi:dihydrodipicolinate synthase/N-acetylneuraminate lyase
MTAVKIMVPVLTLMNANGRVDAEACSAYAERAGATWLDLFLMSGTIGGGESSTPAVRRHVLELWAARVPRDRLLACVWTPDDLAHAADCGVRPIVVLRDLADAAAMWAALAKLPPGAFVYSHPNYAPTTFTPAVAEAARRSSTRPAGGKICKVSLDDVRDLRTGTGDDFQLYDGRCRHVVESVRAGATGVVAVPLCTLPTDLPDRFDTDAVQRTIDRVQAHIDETGSGAERVAMLTEALKSGALA